MPIYRVTPDDTGYPRNHNATLLRDNFGSLENWKEPTFYFTVSKAAPDVQPSGTNHELIEKDLYVHNGKGQLPYEDVVLDFTNPETIKWYQEKLARLIEMEVSAIKVDFGEGAPLDAIYHNGRSGLYEHNLYPLRYNKAVADITRQIHEYIPR